MRILALDSAQARCTAALVVDDAVVTTRSETHGQGQEAVLPVMVQEVLARAAAAGRPGEMSPCIDLIAVTIGPGSFTGIRAGLALAHGIGLALGVPVVGVTVGEAIADAFPHLGDRVLWTVTDSRRGHIFLERDGETVSLAHEALPPVPGKVAIAGGAALQVAARLAATGVNVMLTDARFALPRHIAWVATQRHAGALPQRPAQPLYVDPPEAKLPPGGLRPPPQAKVQ
jgi:tRNA threonylcarbamoyladenosine biosynthesis protein TsaB